MGACSTKEKKPTADAVPPAKTEETTSTVKSANGDAKADAPAAEPDLTQQGILASDAELSAKKEHFEALAKRFNVAASPEVVETTKAALEKNGFTVKVATDAKDALDFITSIPKDGQTIFSGGSRTLDEIGFKDWAKSQTKFKDFKAEALACEAKGDWAGAGMARKNGSIADVMFASVASVSQDGILVWGSLTGTRVSIWSGTLVIVVGTQKIVKDDKEADERLYEWQLPLESARARVVYKVAGSAVNEYGSLRRCNPWAPGSVHVVLVPGVWGY